ncbi:inactive dipeptidyl peptidase 10-like isoform X2 [Bradysia coprophila]|uniref:inactive dipeptidyl peptidase 10-like isoform X2 n=1 Tax=Bradysia coprophila TaxID=38358 RepID=UPI00187DB562|nr:inactive dipeptidyl peptidase 10-like isoform X2 [Bradysia coprophila]
MAQIRRLTDTMKIVKKEVAAVETSPLKKVMLADKKEELVASSPSERNWRGIFIALLVIAAVLGLIVFSIFLLSPEDEGARVKGRRLTLSDINGNGLRWKPFNGSWINDGELVYRDPYGGLSILVIDTSTVKVLMTNTTFRQLNAEKFIVSPDVKYVLLLADCTLSSSRYYVYEVQSQNIFPLSPKDSSREAPLLQHVVWAPVPTTKSNLPGAYVSNAKSGSQAIAFVFENDLYYKPKVQNDLVCRITTTGNEGVIYNGIPDWLYSNVPELKTDTVAFSTDATYLSYLSFNDSLVSKYEYSWLDNSKYPKIKSIRYPKEGTNNPNVTVFVVDLSVLKFINKIAILPPANLNGNNSYVGNMIWLSPIDLSITFTNREQTSALTVVCRAPTFNCTEIHIENIVDGGWIFPAEKPIFSKTETTYRNSGMTTSSSSNATTTPDPNALNNPNNRTDFQIGGFMLKRLPVRDGEHGYYRHVVLISMSDMKSVPLTMGQWEVTEIVGWDEINENVYFMATPKLKPGQRHLYRISLTLNVTKKPNRIFVSSTLPMCMTCENGPHTFKLLSNSSGGNASENFDSTIGHIPNNCLFNRCYFSKDYSYYVQECLGPETPSIYLVETSTMTKIVVLHSGDALRNRLSQLAIPQIRTVSVEIRYGFHAKVRLFLPPGMKEEEEVAFPLIVHMDTSPGSQLVSEKYEIDWNWYLCSQKSMIIAQIDARGSGFQGELLRSQVKSKLGTVEIEDQLGVLTYLRDNLKFVDPTRICAYGWGYGGYAAAMTLAEDSQRVLQCALAINPIVSFAHHNSFFTERYMPRNDDYLRAIQESDLTMKAGNIDSRNFFIVHGTADPIVHQQHSLLLARALIEQGVGFRHQIYSDEGHNLSGVLYHLFKTIEWFFDESFGPVENGEWDPTGFFAFKQ